MTELETIKNILNSKTKNNYSLEELDKLAEVFGIALRVYNNVNDLKILDDLTIEYLINKNIITEEEKNYLEEFRNYTRVYNQQLDEETVNKIKKIIKKIIIEVKNINDSIERKEIKNLIFIHINFLYGIY